MTSKILYLQKEYTINLNEPIDISIELVNDASKQPNCFFVKPFQTTPFTEGNFIASTALGGNVNCFYISLNPHGSGTHTECVGHIAKEKYSVNKTLVHNFFLAQLISVPIQSINNDQVITLQDIVSKIDNTPIEALVIRTYPNHEDKKHRNYSNTNPPYLEPSAATYLRGIGIKHLLIDLPSVDKEKDDGRLSAHKNFWNYPNNPVLDSTITELIYVPNEVKDGIYFLQIQIMNIDLDASPSRPFLYALSVSN